MGDENAANEEVRIEPAKLPVVDGNLPQLSERLPALDLLRGIAILGILPANLIHFLGPMVGISRPAAPESGWNEVLRLVTWASVDGKFITLLSILFGAGLAVQAIKARQAGRRFFFSYWRRLAVLFGIGLLHTAILWQGDILVTYAIVGFFALVISYLPSIVRKLAIAAGLGACYLVVVLVAIFGNDPAGQTGSMANGLTSAAAQAQDNPEAARLYQLAGDYLSEANQKRIFQSANVADMALSRLIHHGIYLVTYFIIIAPYITACFLIGNGLLRRRVFDAQRFARWFVGLGLGVGLPLELIAVGMVAAGTKYHGAASALQFVGALPVSIGYLGFGVLWSHSGKWMWLQKPIQAVGRLALSNYLSQSLLMGLAFYGYGFGLFGVADRVLGMGIVTVIWLLQLILSPLYLRFVHMGPVEWVWRRLAGSRSSAVVAEPPLILPVSKPTTTTLPNADTHPPRLESDPG